MNNNVLALIIKTKAWFALKHPGCFLNLTYCLTENFEKPKVFIF